MGAEFNFTTKATNGQDLKSWFSEIQEEARYDYGHRGYTGSWAEAQGIEIAAPAFEQLEDAEDWLVENCKKWESALAVRVGYDLWAVGAWCSC